MLYRPASFATAAQPKALAVAADATVFVAEAGGVEAVRANQRVFELKPKFSPSAVAASGSVVAIGGEVSLSCVKCSLKGSAQRMRVGHEGAFVRLGRQGSGGGRDARG